VRWKLVCALFFLGACIWALSFSYSIPGWEWIGGLLVVMSFLIAGTEWPSGIEYDAKDKGSKPASWDFRRPLS
jgi:hypothetical protein